VAAANAKLAKQSTKKNYTLAGVWIEVLSDADQRREGEARARFPELIRMDRNLKTDADAEAAMREGLQTLTKARQDNGLPPVCA